MASRLLATYLNDHYAASVGAVELARRTAGSNRGTSYGAALEALAAEIEEDRQALRRIMQSLGIGADRAKGAIAWAAEKLGRFKLNGQLTGYSPLSRLEELEILELGVTGKLLLWEALGRSTPDGIRKDELTRLADRARDQRRRLEILRLDAAGEALDPNGLRGGS